MASAVYTLVSRLVRDPQNKTNLGVVVPTFNVSAAPGQPGLKMLSQKIKQNNPAKQSPFKSQYNQLLRIWNCFDLLENNAVPGPLSMMRTDLHMGRLEEKAMLLVLTS